jgi:hypothetical protein
MIQNIFNSRIGIYYALTNITHNCVCQTNVADICAPLDFTQCIVTFRVPDERKYHLHCCGSLKSRTNVVIQSILRVFWRRKMSTCSTKYLAVTIIIIIIIIIIITEVEQQLQLSLFQNFLEHALYSFLQISSSILLKANFQNLMYNLNFSHYRCVCFAHNFLQA